jgi:hypothetical protein
MAKKLKINGKTLKVQQSTRKNKKFMVDVNGSKVHFGAKGYSISPGTKKGDNYCARSSGIKSGKGITPNKLSRAIWRCKGKRSLR